MKAAVEIIRRLDHSWETCASTWKQAHEEASESSVHDFRVATRRLVATLELARAVFGTTRVPSLERRLRKTLRRAGPLRDLHVQIETLKSAPKNDVVNAFREHLEQGSKREIADIRDFLKRARRERLQARIIDLKKDCEERCEGLTGAALRRAVEGIVGERQERYRKAQSQFKPADEKSLHTMRIALKKYRYAVEGAAAVLGGRMRQEARRMQKAQHLFGDARDLQILISQLQEWAKSVNMQAAARETVRRFERRRRRLIAQIAKIAKSWPRPSGPNSSAPIHPVRETTRALVRPRRSTVDHDALSLVHG